MNHKKLKLKSEYINSLAKEINKKEITVVSYLSRNCFSKLQQPIVENHFKKWLEFERKYQKIKKEMKL